jgi:DNA polymerase V
MKLEFFHPSLSKGDALPLFSATVKAGFPSPADDFVERKLDLNELLIKHPAATFFVRVDGNSMIDASIKDGDILIVDRALTPVCGKIVVAALSGEFTVKRIKEVSGQTFLVAENPNYPPIRVDNCEDFTIFGTVTYVIHDVCAN